MFVYRKCYLYLDRTDVSEGINVNKTSASKECDICHYWYFLNLSFKVQPNICNRCHNSLMNRSDIAILNIKGFAYAVLLTYLAKLRP